MISVCASTRVLILVCSIYKPKILCEFPVNWREVWKEKSQFSIGPKGIYYCKIFVIELLSTTQQAKNWLVELNTSVHNSYKKT